MARKAKLPEGEASIPASTRPAYDAVMALVEPFCQQHLNDEYLGLCRKLAGVLARKRPSPLTRGRPEVWACAILRVIGWVNCLDGGRRWPHLKLSAIDEAFGVAESTGQGKAKAIRDLLRIRRLDAPWMVRRRVKRGPMPWMVEVNGFVLDARRLKREVQEEAFRKGLIPVHPRREADRRER